MNIKGIFLNYNNKQTHVFVGAFWALVSFWKAFACGTHHLMFVWINIFYFMDTFLSFLKAKLISFCRSVTVLHWLPSQTLLMDSLLASPRTPPPKLCILCVPSCLLLYVRCDLRDVYLHNQDGASIFAERRNCMMRSCAWLLGKEALASIITHFFSSGGSWPHRLPPPPPLSASPSLLHLFLSGSPRWSAQSWRARISCCLSAQQTWTDLNWAS